MAVKLKICGITRAEDIQAAVAAGVEAIGLNFWRGSKRVVSIDEAQQMLERAGTVGAIAKVGVFVDPVESELVETHRRLDLDLVQLHGDGPIERYADLGIPYIWVIRGTPELARLELPDPQPAWILLDAHVPGFGGAGRRTDWSWASEAVRRLSPAAVWLAGGITPTNASAAIRRVGPVGLDVASGVESPNAHRGEKDHAKIHALARVCRGS